MAGSQQPPCFDRGPATHHDALVRTTINISDALLASLRERAVQTRRPFREVVEESLRLGLSRSDPGAARRKAPFRVRPHSLGLKPGFHGVSLNQLYDQLESEAGSTAAKPSARDL
jgi:hypothetical protein